MTVEQLIKRLSEYPPDSTIVIYDDEWMTDDPIYPEDIRLCDDQIIRFYP